jgi:hypothetical protein
MSLRDELLQEMRWEMSADPVVQRAFNKIDREERVELVGDEHLMLMLGITKGLRDAILRLADEIDALKLRTAP